MHVTVGRGLLAAAANAIWVGGFSWDDPTTVGAKASVALYHEMQNDIWDWKDLHSEWPLCGGDREHFSSC